MQKQKRAHRIIHAFQKVELLNFVLCFPKAKSDLEFSHRSDFKFLDGRNPGYSLHLNEETVSSFHNNMHY